MEIYLCTEGSIPINLLLTYMRYKPVQMHVQKCRHVIIWVEVSDIHSSSLQALFVFLSFPSQYSIVLFSSELLFSLNCMVIHIIISFCIFIRLPYRTNVRWEKSLAKMLQMSIWKKIWQTYSLWRSHTRNVDTVYHKWGKICCAKLLWFSQFLRVPQKFSLWILK